MDEEIRTKKRERRKEEEKGRVEEIMKGGWRW